MTILFYLKHIADPTGRSLCNNDDVLSITSFSLFSGNNFCISPYLMSFSVGSYAPAVLNWRSRFRFYRKSYIALLYLTFSSDDGGGLIEFVKNGFICKTIPEYTSDKTECICSELNISKSNWILLQYIEATCI